MITLYDFPHGARGLRAAWACEEMGLTYRFEPVEFPPGQSYRDRNPFGKVPFLEDGSIAMSESLAMMIYLAQRYGPTELLPPATDPRFARTLQFALLGEAELASPMTPLLAVRFAAPEEHERNWSAAGIEGRLKTTIERVGVALGKREYLVGAGPTIADISIVTALRIWRRGLGQDLPAPLSDYCARLEGRPACQRAIATHC